MINEQFGRTDCRKDKHFFAFGIVIFICLFISVYFALVYYRNWAGHCEVELDGRINPNIASVESLEMLPGLGPAKASAIVSFRMSLAGDSNSAPFEKADDLQQVPGIGPATVEKIKTFLRFD